MVMQADHRPGNCKGGCGGEGCRWVVKKSWLAGATDVRLAEGLERLTNQNTWNQWQWGPRHPAFYDVDSFRYLACLKVTCLSQEEEACSRRMSSAYAPQQAYLHKFTPTVDHTPAMYFDCSIAHQ